MFSKKRFLKWAKRVTHVIWLGRFSQTNTKVRKITIRGRKEWLRFAKSCYLVWYKNGVWSSPKASNYSLIEFATKYPLKLKRKDRLIITTAFHTLLDKRLVIDGNHRAIGLTNLALTDRPFPQKIVIYECYGSQLHMIFFDFGQFVSNALKYYNPYI